MLIYVQPKGRCRSWEVELNTFPLFLSSLYLKEGLCANLLSLQNLAKITHFCLPEHLGLVQTWACVDLFLPDPLPTLPALLEEKDLYTLHSFLNPAYHAKAWLTIGTHMLNKWMDESSAWDPGPPIVFFFPASLLMSHFTHLHSSHVKPLASVFSSDLWRLSLTCFCSCSPPLLEKSFQGWRKRQPAWLFLFLNKCLS